MSVLVLVLALLVGGAVAAGGSTVAVPAAPVVQGPVPPLNGS